MLSLCKMFLLFLYRKLLKANFLLMRWRSTFLTPFWLVLNCSTRTLFAFNRSRLLLFRLSSQLFGVLAEFFSSLFDSSLASRVLLDTSSFSFLSLSSGHGKIRRFLIFECECALASPPDGRFVEITLRCKRFFFGAHKICSANAGLSSMGGVTCTVDTHPSILFKEL